MTFTPTPNIIGPEKPLRWADIWLPITMVSLMWLVHIVQWAKHINLIRFGITPKTASGLIGIITAPLVHADWGHLASNSIPMLVSGGIICYFYPSIAQRAFAMIYVLTGLMVWLFAKNFTTHIGASGVVYGLVAFIAWLGIFRRSVKAIILALLVVILYGGMLAGIAPNPDRPNISWESHLLGGLMGIFAAFYYKDLVEEDELPVPEAPPTPQKPFLPRDIFEKTIAERTKEREEQLGQIRAYYRQQEELRRQMLNPPPSNTDWT